MGKDKSFEESLKVLENMAESIRDENTSLDDAIKCYENGIKAYKDCYEILNNTKQKIEVFQK